MGRPPAPEQRRFTTDVDEYLALLAELDSRTAQDSLVRIGAAPHSLRAVAPSELEALLGARPDGPIHIHAAERTEEVAEVTAGLGARPIEWLLAHTPIDERWTVIHATHMTAAERQRLAGSGAVAGVCPLTEANLADGRFDLAEYRHEGGRLGVGTDANHLIDLPGELRMLEYGQRIVGHRRDSLLEDGEIERGCGAFRTRCKRRRPGPGAADRRHLSGPALRPRRTRPNTSQLRGTVAIDDTRQLDLLDRL